MFVVICYDVFDNRRRSRIAKKLEGYGERVQDSVFECWLEPARLNRLKAALEKLMDCDVDRIRYYRLCDKDANDIAIDGRGKLTQDMDCIVF
jgi:CRISPR-associated protein Cas2